MLPHSLFKNSSSSYALIRIGVALLTLASLLLHQSTLSFSNDSHLFAITYLVFALATFGLTQLPTQNNRIQIIAGIVIDTIFISIALSNQNALPLLAASPLLMLSAAWILSRTDHKLVVLFHISTIAISTVLSEWSALQSFQFITLSYIAMGSLYSLYQAKLLDTPKHKPEAAKPVLEIKEIVSHKQKKHSTKSEKNNPQNYSILLNNTSTDKPLLQQLQNWGGKITASDDVIEALSNTLSLIEDNPSLTAFIIDLRERNENPTFIASLIRSSKKMQHIRCILIADKQAQQENQSQWNKQQFNAGYDAVLTSPLDTTLLFNALHSDENNIEAVGVTSLFDHYVQSKSSLPPLEILLAENNPIQLKIIKRQLASFGHNVYSTNSGEQALDAMITHRFDVAMLSLQLDEIDGIEASRIYRLTHPRSLAAPIVILTNNNNTEIQQHCDYAGANAVIKTPITSIELQKVIADVLDASKSNIKDDQPNWDTPLNSENTKRDAHLLDLDTLRELEQLGDGLSFVQDLIDNFIKDSNDLIKQMQHAIHENNFVTYQDCAHAIKGSAGSVGASQLQHIAKNIANCTIQDYQDSAHTQVDLLNETLKLTHDALLVHVNERNEHSSNH